MKLRAYEREDSPIIASWIRSEKELYQWSADRYGFFPLLPCMKAPFQHHFRRSILRQIPFYRVQLKNNHSLYHQKMLKIMMFIKKDKNNHNKVVECNQIPNLR